MTDALDTFRRRLLADAAAQERLDRTMDPVAFAGAALAQAHAWGLTPTRDSLLDGAPPLPVAHPPGPGWLAARVRGDAAAAQIDWARVGDDGLSHSFFADSAAAARARPLNRLLRPVTPLADLPDQDRAPVEPAGFVFHMSRCGSTLVAQMLAALPGVAVLSEPDPFDAVLRHVLDRPDDSVARHVALLRAMLTALSPRDRRIVVKLDSWHILAFPLLRAAFPAVPFVYLFRDPAEVLVSHRRRPGMQTVPDLMPRALRPAGTPPIAVEARAAWMLAVFHRSAGAALAEAGGLAIAYPTLPMAVVTRIVPHFGLTLDAAGRTALTAAARRDAKYPDRPFRDDTSAKRAACDAPIRDAAARLADLHGALLARSGAPPATERR